ncbi:MAG: peptidylprolyl isomerase [Acidimicrobiales bacterium]
MVNGTVISQHQVDQLLAAIRKNPAYLSQLEKSGPVRGKGSGTYDTSFVDQLLDQQISLALVHQAVLRRGIQPGPTDVRLARADAESSFGTSVFGSFPASYRQQVTRQFAEVTALAAAVSHVDLSQGGLRHYYASHRSDFARICSSYLAVGTRAAARDLRSKVEGGLSFAQAAAAHTDSAQGGTLGCGLAQQYGQVLGPAAEAAVVSLSPGQVTHPIQGSAGWELLQVTSRTPESFSQASPEIRSTLLSPTAPALSKTLAKLSDQARITVNPVYGELVRKSGQRVVVPPASPPSKAIGLPSLGG